MEAGRIRRLLGPLSAAALLTTALSSQVFWENRSTSAGARYGLALAFDLIRGRTVLFGGSNRSAQFADTWEWDGTIWTHRLPASTPPARVLHAMAYDLARGRTVLFGGDVFQNGVDVPLADTWEWDGANW